MFDESISVGESCTALRTTVGLFSLNNKVEVPRRVFLLIWYLPSVFFCAHWAVVLSCRWRCTLGKGKVSCRHDPSNVASAKIPTFNNASLTFSQIEQVWTDKAATHLPFCSEAFLADFTMFWVISIVDLQVKSQRAELFETFVALRTMKGFVRIVCLEHFKFC